MDKLKFITHVLMALFLTALLADCAGTTARESTGEYVDDAVIATKVKAEIFNDPQLRCFRSMWKPLRESCI